MSDSFVPIIRKKLDEIIARDDLTPNAKLLLIHYITNANYTTGIAKRGDAINRGSMVTSVAITIKALDISEKTYYKVLEILESKGLVEKKANTKGTIIQVKNYTKYVDNNTSKKSGGILVKGREGTPTFSRTKNNIYPESSPSSESIKQSEPSRSFESRISENNQEDWTEHSSSADTIPVDSKVKFTEKQIKVNTVYMDYLNDVYGPYMLIPEELISLNQKRLQNKNNIDNPVAWLEKCLHNTKIEITSKTLREGISESTK